MYRIDEAKKRDAKSRWALPDRVFFACGACHILALAFLERYGSSALKATWIIRLSRLLLSRAFFHTPTAKQAVGGPGGKRRLSNYLLTYSFRNQSHEPRRTLWTTLQRTGAWRREWWQFSGNVSVY